MAFCPKCGAEISEYYNFCQACGAKLQQEKIGAVSEAEPKKYVRYGPSLIPRAKKDFRLLIQYKWDVRVGHPRKLFRAVQDFLDDCGYEHGEPRELKPVEDPIEGTAQFEDIVTGKRDYIRWSMVQLIASLVLALVGFAFLVIYAQSSYQWQLYIGAAMLVLAIPLALTSRSTMRRVISIRLAGESYRASAYGEASDRSQREVLGIVSDARLTVTAVVGKLAHEDWVRKPTRDRKEWATLENDVRKIRAKVDELLPRLALPIVDDLSQR